MTLPIGELKNMHASFEIEQGNRDYMVLCAADALMPLSNGIDEDFLLSLDSDINNL